MNVHLLDHHARPRSLESPCVLAEEHAWPLQALHHPMLAFLCLFLLLTQARSFNTQTHIVARHTHTPAKYTNLPALSFPPTQVLLQALPPAWKTKKTHQNTTTGATSNVGLPATTLGGRALSQSPMTAPGKLDEHDCVQLHRDSPSLWNTR